MERQIQWSSRSERNSHAVPCVAPLGLTRLNQATHPQLALWATRMSPTSSADRNRSDSNRIENFFGGRNRGAEFADDDAGCVISQHSGFSH
jgi:hypothetical protein